MKARIIIGGVIATLVVGGSAIALGDSAERRTPVQAPHAATPIQQDLNKAQRRLIQARNARVRCRTLSCINRALTKLGNAVGTLGHVALECEQYIDVTRYGSYAYSNDGGATFGLSSALDYTEAGDAVSNHVVVYVC